MGQLIDFEGRTFKKHKPALQDVDIISLLPNLKNLKGEVIVVNISQKVWLDNELLSKLLREIVTVKCMGAIVIVIPDINNQIDDFCKEAFESDKQLNFSNYVNLFNQFDLLDVIVKREVIDKITTILKSFNAMSLGIAGHNLDIIFPDDLVNKEVSVFDKPNKAMYRGMSEKKGKQYSLDMLEELLKTDIIPVIAPTFKIKNGSVFAMETSLFGSYLATYLSSLKYVEIYTDEKSIPTSSIYGVERFKGIVKTGNFSQQAIRLMHAGMEAVKNGIQGAHIIDIKYASLLEEFCNKSFVGLFLYDDTLNQL